MYCKNCGNQLNNGETICQKCGTQIQINNNIQNNNNNNNNNVNQIPNSPKKVSYLKAYLKFGCGGAFLVFILLTLLSFFLGIAIPEFQDLNNETSKTLSSIRILIPMMLIMFGWIPAIIYATIKNNKNQ